MFVHHRFANQSDGVRIIPSSLFARLANQYFGINEQSVTNQSLEFVAETRILAEMKIKNRGKNFFRRKTNWQAYFFLKTVRRCSRKYGNHAVNECEFASEIERWWSYRSWTFAYFKLFPWRKYTAGPDWSKKFVNPYPPGYSYMSSASRDPDTPTRVGGPSTGIRVHE